MARAVYRRADIYLLDDPLSAVDAHVAQHIYRECITKVLKGRRVVFCTHERNLMSDARVVLLGQGKGGEPSLARLDSFASADHPKQLTQQEDEPLLSPAR